MEESRESIVSTTKHEHKDDGPAPPLLPVRKKPRYRGADFVDPEGKTRPKPREKNEKVIYQPSLDQSLLLAVAKVIDGEPGDIAYWLRYRGSKERYYDGNRGVFVGEELQNDPSVTQLTELDDVDSS